VGDAELGPGLLPRHEVRKGRVADAGGAEGVDVAGVAGPAEVGGGEGGDGAAEGVARHDELVGRVGGAGGGDGGEERGGDFVVGGLEAGVDLAVLDAEPVAGVVGEEGAGFGGRLVYC